MTWEIRVNSLIKILFSFLLFIACTISAENELETGEKYTRELEGGETDIWELELDEGEFVYIRVMQSDLDIILKLYDPGKNLLIEHDSPNGENGYENLTFHTITEGVYSLEISVFEEDAPQGSYTIELIKAEKSATDIPGKIDQMLAAYSTDENPGAALAVLKDGDIVYSKGVGTANFEYEIPITENTIFHIASVSKQFTAFAIAMLSRNGELSLNDDIRKYIPEIHDFGYVITISNLLNHTSGLRDQWNLLSMSGWKMDDVITKDHILNMIGNQQQLNFVPGDELLYCNTGYTLLAEIVERITGEKFSAWMKKNVFEPLGMDNTLFYDDHTKIVKNRAYSYTFSGKEGYKKRVLNYANVGATSLFTTATDLTKWIRNFKNPVVGDQRVMALMHKTGRLNNGDHLSYAFGQGHNVFRGVEYWSHGGADAGYRSWMGRFPEKHLGIVVLSNYDAFAPAKIGHRIAALFIPEPELNDEEESQPDEEKSKLKSEESEQKPDETIVDAKLLDIYSGNYKIDQGIVACIRHEKERLTGQLAGDEKHDLIPMNDSTFVIGEIESPQLTIIFHPGENDRCDSILIREGKSQFTGRRVKTFNPSGKELNEFCGIYYSFETYTRYDIKAESDTLKLCHIKAGKYDMHPAEYDNFIADIWFMRDIKFTRNGDGRINGFLASNGRVRNLRFDKVEIIPVE